MKVLFCDLQTNLLLFLISRAYLYSYSYFSALCEVYIIQVLVIIYICRYSSSCNPTNPALPKHTASSAPCTARSARAAPTQRCFCANSSARTPLLLPAVPVNSRHTVLFIYSNYDLLSIGISFLLSLDIHARVEMEKQGFTTATI